jgi:2-methylcitrate dehydratase PrpD
MSIIQELVRNVLETKYEAFDQETVSQAKNRIIDTIGALIGGADAPGCSMILDLVREWGGKAESTVLAHGIKAPAQNVAMVTSIMARSNDFEPAGGPEIDGKKYPAHFSATNVSTAFAVAEQRGASGKELVTALILGDDLASRIGVASNVRSSIDTGWDTSGICNRFGATAIAGRLGMLNERQLVNAFGIVLNQLGGTMQAVYDGTHSFKLHQGLASWAGIFSAELASKGFTGAKDPLLSKFGYYNLYCREPIPEIATMELGKKFYADSEFKLYPCCRGNHSSIECALELVQENDIEPGDINEITIIVPPERHDSFLVQPFEVGEVPQANAAFNLPYCVASALLRKSVVLEHFTEEFIREPKIIDLINKVKIDATMPIPAKRTAAIMKIKMNNGREFSTHVEVPRGDVEYGPLSKEEIRDKFRANVAFSKVVDREDSEKALNLLDNMEEQDTIFEIIKLLEGSGKR